MLIDRRFLKLLLPGVQLDFDMAASVHVITIEGFEGRGELPIDAYNDWLVKKNAPMEEDRDF